MTRISATRALAVAVLTSSLASGCRVEEEPFWTSPVAFDTARAWLHAGTDTTPLLLELARTEEQISFGLMLRPALDRGSGMVFLYDSVQPPESGFWMFRTKIPLDIAFLDATGTIDTILTMAPCESLYPEGCPHYSPGVEYRAALEVNAGWFREHGIGEGNRLVVDTTDGLPSPVEDPRVGRP